MRRPKAPGARDAGNEGSGKRHGWAAALANPAAWPLHPFLFAAASVLALYVSNLRETTFPGVAPTLLTALAAALVLFVLFAASLRTLGPRAAIAASIILVAALYHADLAYRLRQLTGGADSTIVVPLLIGLAAMLLLLALRLRVDLVLPNALLNGIALVLFVTPAWKAVSYAVLAERPAEQSAGPVASWAGPGAAFAAPATAGPDIFYLILDRYASEATLSREYGFDNRPFLDRLRERGFYVASESHSNYPKTAPSLAATFAMDYLDFADDPRARRNEWHPIYEMLSEHRVGRFLTSRGYRFIQIGSWWAPTQRNEGADEVYSFGFSEFAWLYLRRTVVPRLVETVAPGSSLALRMAWDNGQCQRVPRQFEKLKEIADRPETTFTFAHILLPHEPYRFDAAGRCRPLAEVAALGPRLGYLRQLRHTNALLDDLLDHLLALPEKPIVILQADEGPYPEPYRTSNRSWHLATTGQLAMKSGILNAMYFPDGRYEALDPAITPVNTFRVLFDKYFGTTHGRLPDRIHAFPDYSRIYDFFDVTEPTRRGDTAGS